MKSNTSLFKSQVGSKRRWEKWNENLYNKFLPTTADSTSSSFHDKCRASFRILWNSVYLNAFESHISLCSSGNSAALCLSNGNTINLCTSSSDISFGRLEESAGDIYVYVGETSGTISIFLLPPSHSQVHLIAKSHASPSSPVDFIHPFQGEHDPTNTIHLWVITGQNMYLLSGSYCSPTFEQARSSSTETIELSARAQFQLALPRSSSLLFVQALNTASGGASALLALHFLSPTPSSSAHADTPSSVLVFIVNAKQALVSAQESASPSKSAAPESITLQPPTLVLPFVSAASCAGGGVGAGVGSVAASLFGIGSGRRTTSSQEVPIAALIEQKSVRTVGRNTTSTNTATAVSFVLRVLGSEGTECAASFKTAHQRALDQLLRSGVNVFAQAGTLNTSCNSAEGEELLEAYCESIVFRVDGSVFRDLAPVTLEKRGGGGERERDGERLWRACLRLQLLPRWRLTDVTAAQQGLLLESGGGGVSAATSSDAAAPPSSTANALGRLVLMEVAMSSGLAFLVAQYVLARDPSSADEESGYLLSDVKRVYEWAVGVGQAAGSRNLRSVQSSLEQATSVLCRRIVDGAVRSGNNASSAEAIKSELQSIRDSASGLKMVVEALLERKLQALEGKDQEGVSSVMLNVIEEGHTALRVQVQEVKCLLQTLSMLIEVVGTPQLKFTSLLPSEVHQQQGGKVQSSASSAAASASMLSEYHLAVSERLQTAAHLRYLPEYLRGDGSRLLDELCALLGEHALYATQFLRQDSDSSLGVNLGNLSQSVATLFMLPLTGLRAEAAEGIAAMTRAQRQGLQASQNLESSLASKVSIAHSVVLYFLLDMFHLSTASATSSSSASSNSNSSTSADRLKGLVARLGRAADLPHTAQMGLLALWQIDAAVHVPEAVALICSAHTTVQQDQNILAAVLKRLFSSNQIAECSTLLAHLKMSGHSIVGTKFFVMATAAAVSRADMWQYSWHTAKVQCAQLYAPGSEQHVLVTRELMHMLIQWALIHDEMGRLLDAVLDNEEKDEVELVLRDLAMADVQQGRVSSPPVDLCVAFLLRISKYVDAMEVHERHAFTVTNAGQLNQQSGSDWATHLQALESRRMLIEAHASIPTISKDNFK